MKKLLSFLLSTILLFSLGLNLNAQNDTSTVIILHTNDMHSHIDNFPKVAYLIEQYRQKYDNVLLFSAGDLFTGNPIVDKYKQPGYPMIDLMNYIKYDISCIGNHEFDVGQKQLNLRMKQANFPFVCANINTSKAVLNQPKAYDKIRLKNGITIGVLGLLEIEKNGMPASNPVHLKGIKFSNPFICVKKYITYKDSSDIYILLSHLGIESDEKMAEENTCFDVIVGGHSHTYLQGGKHVNGTFILQAGSYLRALGVLTLKIYKGKIVFESDTLIDTKNIKGKDEKMQKIVDNYDNNPYFDKVVGVAKNNIVGPSQLGALMTDAMRDTLKCDIAFQNIGGIRTHEFVKGNITKKMIYELSPFGNVFIVYKLSIKQIKELIKYAYELEKSNELQVSGMNMILTIDKNKNLTNIKLLNNKGKQLKDKLYTVAINDYMASAYVLKFLKTPIKKTAIVDAEATMGFLKKNSPVDYSGVQRVKIIHQ